MIIIKITKHNKKWYGTLFDISEKKIKYIHNTLNGLVFLGLTIYSPTIYLKYFWILKAF